MSPSSFLPSSLTRTWPSIRLSDWALCPHLMTSSLSSYPVSSTRNSKQGKNPTDYFFLNLDASLLIVLSWSPEKILYIVLWAPVKKILPRNKVCTFVPLYYFCLKHLQALRQSLCVCIMACLCVNPLPAVYVTRIEQCITKSRTVTQDVNRLKPKRKRQTWHTKVHIKSVGNRVTHHWLHHHTAQ